MSKATILIDDAGCELTPEAAESLLGRYLRFFQFMRAADVGWDGMTFCFGGLRVVLEEPVSGRPPKIVDVSREMPDPVDRGAAALLQAGLRKWVQRQRAAV